MKTLRQIISGGSNLKLAIAVTALAVCFSLLLVKIYRAQTELRESVLNNFKQDLEKHAAALSYFYSERKNDLKNLPTKREISIYFENKALGMSMEYGLRASLMAIQESLDQVLKERVLGQDRIYTRFIFADSSGECLIDSQRTPVSELTREQMPRISDSGTFRAGHSGQAVEWFSAINRLQPLFL